MQGLPPPTSLYALLPRDLDEATPALAPALAEIWPAKHNQQVYSGITEVVDKHSAWWPLAAVRAVDAEVSAVPGPAKRHASLGTRG